MKKFQKSSAIVGILGVQGCIAPHVAILNSLNIRSKVIIASEDLSGITHIILPGGESGTMIKLMESAELFDPLKEMISKTPTWGICAGAILLASEVVNPTQKSFASMNIKAHRNFYGSQLDSFKAEITEPFNNMKKNVDFIRAPKLSPLRESVKVLISHKNEDVLLQEGNKIASSFHTELGEDPWLHEHLLSIS